MSVVQKPRNFMREIDDMRRKAYIGATIEHYDPEDRPGPVPNVRINFRIREKRTRARYIAVVLWDNYAPGTCQADIFYYKVQIRATDSAGNPIPQVRIKRNNYLINDPDDAEADVLKMIFHDIEHPKKWYWQARVCAIDKDNRKGQWSAWTAPELPHAEANPSPPVPSGLAVSFDKGEKGRGEARYRMIVKFNEIAFWDIPPTQDTDKVTYSLQGIHGINADTFNFSSTANFPNPVNGERISLRVGYGDNREIISYKGKTATTLTGVRRGLDGTAAREWPDGTDVTLSATDAQERQNDLDRYEVQIRRCDANGNWVKNDANEFIQRMKSRSWDKEDDDPGSVVRVYFPNIRKRHKWQVRVRTRDRFNRRGDWSDWFPGLSAGSFASPSDTTAPPTITSGSLVMQVSPRRIELIWDAPRDTEDQDADSDMRELDPDIRYFQVQVSNRSDFDKSLSSYWRFDAYHGTMKKAFHKKKTDRGPFHARVRCVDGSGNKSAWVTTNKQRKRPGKVRNREVRPRTRAVIVKFDPPNTWEDGTTDEWDISEVSHYEVYLYRNGALYDQDPQVLSTRKSFPILKADANATFSAQVRAIGHEGDYATEDAATGSATPESAGAESFAELLGSISWGQFGGFGAVFIQSTTPSGSLKDGDIWIHTGDGNRLYRYYSTSKTFAGQTFGPGWVKAADGGDLVAASVTADRIFTSSLAAIKAVLGTVYAGSIYGSKFSTEPSTTYTSTVNYIEISGSGETDYINFRQKTGFGGVHTTHGYIYKNAAANMQFKSGADGNLGFDFIGAAGLTLNGPITLTGASGNTIQVGDTNSPSNKVRLRNTGQAVGTPGTGYCDVHYRGDLSPSELRVIFPNGVVKTLATA